MTAETQTTPAALRREATNNRKTVHNLRNGIHEHLTRYGSKMPRVEHDSLARLARLSQTALEEVHNVEAGVKLLVRSES